MKYENFLNKCKELGSSFEGDGNFEESYRASWRYDSKKVNEPRLYVEWSTGGISGGSCWESSDPQPYTSNSQPKELAILDAILEEICPNISFLQYKNLTSTLVKCDTRSECEYYGNQTDYATKSVDVKDLYDYLSNKGFLPVD
jgi:hypothetical protein